MSPSQLRVKIIAERVAWIQKMLENIRSLPLDSYTTFQSDPRNFAAAESYLRRAWEALLDLGRHILSKGFGLGPLEYKEVAVSLMEKNVLNKEQRDLLRELAGYRNRMVHFYHEINDRELYEICSKQCPDVEKLLDAILKWVKAHPEMIDKAL